MQKTIIQRPFNRSIVYIHWSKNTCLYVGKSVRGFSRPFCKTHKIWKHRKEITRTDIYYLKTAKDASFLELKLILKLRPSYDESTSRLLRGGFGESSYLSQASDKEIEEFIKSRFSALNSLLANRMTRFIVLFYREKRTGAEVAEELNMSLGAVKSVIYRIQRAIKCRGDTQV